MTLFDESCQGNFDMRQQFLTEMLFAKLLGLNSNKQKINIINTYEKTDSPPLPEPVGSPL